MRHNQDGHDFFEFVYEFFDTRGGNRIKRRSRLIKQHQLRLGGERARNTQALLLTSGKIKGQVTQPVFYLVPQGGTLERGFHLVVQGTLVVITTHAQAIGNIFINRLGERIRLLKHHANTHAYLNRVHIRVQQIGVVRVQYQFAFIAISRIEVVHPVKAAQKSGFATARRTNQRGDLLFVNRQVDLFDRLKIAVVEVEVACFRLDRMWRCSGSGSSRSSVYHLMFFLKR